MRLAVTILCAAHCAALGPRAVSEERAVAAYDGFITHYYDRLYPYFFQYPRPSSSEELTGYWTFANAWHSVSDRAALAPGANWTTLLTELYESRAVLGWIDDYYDDEEWMIDALVAAYRVTKDERLLDTAKMIHTDVWNAWDTTCCIMGNLGGNWWNKEKTYKATASNAGGVVAAMRLYSVAPDPMYLERAELVYAFWRRTVADVTTGHVNDGFGRDGVVGDGPWTYNQGLMMGGAVLLFNTTLNNTYLTDAVQYAKYLMYNMSVATPFGQIMHNDCFNNIVGDCAQFHGPTIRFLIQLLRQLNITCGAQPSMPVCSFAAPLAVYIDSNLDSLWHTARDPKTNLFSYNWGAPYNYTANNMQQQQNCAVTAFSLHACLTSECSPPL